MTNQVIRGQIKNLPKALSVFSAFSDMFSENDAVFSLAIAFMVSAYYPYQIRHKSFSKFFIGFLSETSLFDKKQSQFQKRQVHNVLPNAF